MLLFNQFQFHYQVDFASMNNLVRSTRQAVLVPQADSMGAIAVIRSLGQHGYQVHATSTKPDALGCRSTFATFAHTSPAYQSLEYIPWLRQLLAQHRIQAIIPSEGFLLAIKHHFHEFAPLMDIPQDQGIAYGCLSKVEVSECFLRNENPQLKMHLPKTCVITTIDELSTIELSDWSLPFFIKGDAVYNRHGDDALVIKVKTIDALRVKATEALDRFEKILIQDCFSGEKATVNLLFQNGNSIAESMVLATHENPHSGGLMALRHSWWEQKMYEDALCRLKALRWNGVAMMEYKWDKKTQQFAFIEINARYWAALHLDILAGLHFPAIQLDHFFNRNLPVVTTRLTKSITVRHAFPADFGYLLSKLRDPSVNVRSKLKSMIGFVMYFFHPGIRSDLNYAGDRKLVLFNAKAFFSDLFRSIFNKF